MAVRPTGTFKCGPDAAWPAPGWERSGWNRDFSVGGSLGPEIPGTRVVSSLSMLLGTHHPNLQCCHLDPNRWQLQGTDLNLSLFPFCLRAPVVTEPETLPYCSPCLPPACRALLLKVELLVRGQEAVSTAHIPFSRTSVPPKCGGRPASRAFPLPLPQARPLVAAASTLFHQCILVATSPNR